MMKIFMQSSKTGNILNVKDTPRKTEYCSKSVIIVNLLYKTLSSIIFAV